MTRTPNEWVERLTAWFQAELPQIDRLKGYTTGGAPLPELNKHTREGWKKFQRLALTNAGALVVSTLAERVIPNGIIISDSPYSKSKTETARRIWRDNRLDVSVQDALRDCFTTGRGYLLVTRDDESGAAVVTREDPSFFYAVPDPLRPWKARAAIKIWRDRLEEKDHLVMWADGLNCEFTRNSYSKSCQLLNTVRGGWVLNEESINYYDGSVPVVVLENRDGKGEFEDHTNLIDRINWLILQMLSTTSMQAFKQRALQTSETGPGLADKDEEGNAIDYAAIFQPAPGALWELPPGVSIWESSQSDVQPMLAEIKSAWQELAAHTATPLSTMLPDSANQSAAGAEAPQRSLVDKARDRISRVRPALAVCMVKALAVEGVELEENETLEVIFEPPHAVSMTEKYAAAAQAKAAGESLETIQRNILGYSPEQVAADKQRRAAEQLASELFTLPAQRANSRPDIETPPNGESGAGSSVRAVNE